jgi:hypothetical protein
MLVFLARALRQEKVVKGIQIGNEEVKLSLFAVNVNLYFTNPKDSTRKFLDLINTFIKIAGYKINMQKSLALLYINNERAEKEIEKTIPFIMASKN